MRFELSEQIRTPSGPTAVANALESQLRKISQVAREGDNIRARSIEASFGSINRYDNTLFTVQQKGAGVLCVAEVMYRPSAAFWLFFVLGLFAYGLLFWIPIIFYLSQKRTVRSAITDVFVRVKNELEIESKPMIAGAGVRAAQHRFCGSCGNEVAPANVFCTSCGTRLASEISQ